MRKKKRLERKPMGKNATVDKMRRERNIGKRKRSQKSKLYFVQFWGMRKKKRLERKPNGQKCYGKKLKGKGQLK